MRNNAAARWIASYFVVIPFAWRGFLSGEHSPFTSDIRHYHHPVTQALIRAWHDGRLPLWADETFLGFPLFADPQTAVFYPGTLLPICLGPHWGYIVFLVLHSLLVAIGMFALMRSHRVDPLGAWCAGTMVALSGYFAHEAQHPGLFAILCWIPTWLWTTHRFMQHPSPMRAVGAAAVVAMMIFAGTLQVMFGAIVLYGFYVVGLSIEIRAQSGAAVALRRFASTAAVQILGLSIAAVSLLPAIEHLPTTARALGMTYRFASMGSVHVVEWLGLFVNGSARWLGAGLALDHEGASFYLGSIAIPLFALGLLAKRNAVATAVALATAVLGIIAMGRYGGLHPLLYQWSPDLVGGLRGMGRALGPASVGVAFLVGLGVQSLGTPSRRVDRIFGVAGAATVALHLFAFVSSGSLAAAALASGCAMLLALLAFAAFRKRSTTSESAGPVRLVLQRTVVVIAVVDLVAFGALDGVLRANPPPPVAGEMPDAIPELDILAGRAVQAPAGRIMLHGFGPLNLPLLHGFDGVGGYNPLVALQYLDFVNLINQAKLLPRTPIDQFVSGSKPQVFSSPLFDAASVRFVVSSRPERTHGLQRIERYTDSHLGGFGAALYENPDPLPRAYLATRTRHAYDLRDLETLLSRNFDPRRVTVVEGEGPVLSGESAIVPVVRERFDPEYLSFRIETEQPAVLVVTDSWHAGWHAWVDGEPAPIFRVNGLFRGVEVAPGSRAVEMRFSPTSFWAGATLSSLAVAGMLLLGVLHLARRVRGAFGR